MLKNTCIWIVKKIMYRLCLSDEKLDNIQIIVYTLHKDPCKVIFI